ncbi:MAG: hypothetical protein JWM27_5043 [Gemmatimonadetes bacterium]|nr:hypothetical protein [Gemmatimonadota bacterium]
MRRLASAVLAVSAVLAAALLSASPAQAQHCWPTAVAIVLRDSHGRVVDAKAADEVAVAPRPSRDADFSFALRQLGPEWGTPALSTDTVPSSVWMGRGTCSIDIDTVTVRRGRWVMRLLPGIHVNSLRRPGRSVYVVDTPRFRPGTYRLSLCELPKVPMDAPAVIPATAWVRERRGGDPSPCPPTPSR